MNKQYKYTHAEGLGFGAHHAEGSLNAESERLDMPDGTTVELLGRDDERDLSLVQWTDTEGNTRITSVTDEQFDEFFEEV